ncbi:MAG: tetratricopeptide repeat protein [Pirellulaceae bacterium]
MTKKGELKQASPYSLVMVRRFLVALPALAILAAGVYLVGWMNQPTLEPLPSLPMERTESKVRGVIESAAARVASNNRAAAAWGDLGFAYYSYQFDSQAQVCFRNAERLDPSDYRFPYFLGLSLNSTDAIQTLVAYRRAADLCGNRVHVQLRLVDLLLDQGELEDAELLMNKVLAHSSSSAHAQFAKARLLLAQGKINEAKTWAERCTVSAPEKRSPQLLLAQLCRRTQDVAGEAKVLAVLQKLPDEFTVWEDPDVTAILARRQDRASNLAKAKSIAKNGQTTMLKSTLYEMAAGEEGANAVVQLALLLDSEGRPRDSETLLRRQLLTTPNDERLHFHVALACFHQQKFPSAEVEFRRAIEIKPDYFDAWYNLGLTLLVVGKQDGARDAFTNAVRVNPSRALARIHLAELLLVDGKRQQAREHLEVAIKIEPEHQKARELLARCNESEK